MRSRRVKIIVLMLALQILQIVKRVRLIAGCYNIAEYRNNEMTH